MSPSNLYELLLQSDGNVCTYMISNMNANVWCFPLKTITAKFMVLDTTGNLSILDSSYKVLWASSTSTSAGALYMQDDGNLVLYDGSPSGRALWDSKGL